MSPRDQQTLNTGPVCPQSCTLLKCRAPEEEFILNYQQVLSGFQIDDDVLDSAVWW